MAETSNKVGQSQEVVNPRLWILGYKDRMAHRIGKTEFNSDTEREAYESGVLAAERAIGFVPC